jgi:hypothetical protein
MFLRYEPCPKCREGGRDSRGDNLGVYSDGSKHCFASCGYHVFPTHYVKPVVYDTPKSTLPSDFTREVPAMALKWLLQYGLPWSYWKEFIGYSPKEERLVFLVSDAFSIGRYVGTQVPAPRKWYAWGYPHKHCEVVNPKAKGLIVLVEDIVSAHKVGQTHTTIPLFGVNICTPHLYALMAAARPVSLWLDADQRGTITGKAAWLQSLTNTQVNIVNTPKDPKEYSSEEIVRILHETV